MPNRILREGILDSEAVNKLSPRAELFYRRLMSRVDDFGRFDARTNVLRAHLYPLQQDRVREADISRWIAECEKAGLIRLYTVSGKQYLLFLNLGQARAKSSKYPAPPASDPAPARSCAQTRPYSDSYSDSINTPLPPETGEGGGEASPGETQSQSPPAHATSGTAVNGDGDGDDGFAAFWAAYPRRTRIGAARTAWAMLRPDATLRTVILRAIDTQKRSPQWQREQGRYVPAPANWLRDRCWEDAPPERTAGESRAQREARLLRERGEREAEMQRLEAERQQAKPPSLSERFRRRAKAAEEPGLFDEVKPPVEGSS